MALRIHTIRTGSVRVRQSQMRGEGHGLRRRIKPMLGGPWSDWLPINVWAIEHPDGLVLVDTGETSRVMEPGWFPRWHPYFRRAVAFDVRPEDELGPQLREHGLPQPSTVVLSHLHTDHAGGLEHVAGARTLVSADELKVATKLNGYLPHRWPATFAPEPIQWHDTPVGPFERSFPLTDGITILPAPGHTPGHVIVLVDDGETRTLLAADAAYTRALLASETLDGVSADEGVAAETMRRINALGADDVRVSHET